MQLPDSFVKKMTNLLGQESSDFFASLDKPNQKGISVNYSKISESEFDNLCDFEHCKIEEISNGYYVDNIHISTSPLHHGIIYSQEPSAMYPVEMLDIKPDDIVLDVCAAPGGKSIQILEKLNGKGILLSNEIVYSRAKILYENLSRMGFQNFAISSNSPQDFESLNIQFDKILVDAPCGGEGMFRKNGFEINDYNPDAIDTNAKRQLSILESVKDLLKDGGKLVYSTCTYDIRENEEIVAKFLKDNPEFQIVPVDTRFNSCTCEGVDIPPYHTNLSKRRYPHKFKGEGQFMCLLQKTGESTHATYEFFAKGYSIVSNKDKLAISNATKNLIDIGSFSIAVRNDTYYILPEVELDYGNLNILSIGTVLGTKDKNEIKLNHTFYHTFGNNFVRQVELNDNQLPAYLHGEEVDTESESNGIVAVTYKHIPLGGGKVVNGRLKNYYPKNYRI